MTDLYKPTPQEIQQFVSNLHTYTQFRAANLKKAQKYRDTNSVRYATGAKIGVDCQLDELAVFGPGVLLYFRFVKTLMVMFMLMLLISVPALLSNYKGKGLELFGNTQPISLQIMKISLANQRYYEWSQLNPAEHFNISINRRIIVCTDLLVSIIFFFFIVYWRAESQRIVSQTMENAMLPSVHTVFIPNLPHNTTEQLLMEHFSQFGKVSQVSGIKDLSRIQKMVREFGQTVDKFKIAQYTKPLGSQLLYNLYRDLVLQYHSLKLQYRRLQQQPYISAFVSFQSTKTTKLVVKLYQDSECKSMQKFQLLDQKIKVEKCQMEPINILWENIHIKPFAHFQKALLLGFLLISMLFTSLAVLFYIKVNSNSGFIIDEMAEYTFQEVLRRKQNHVTDTFCYKLNYRSFRAEYYNMCRESLNRFTNYVVWTVSFSCVIVFVNYLIRLVIQALARFRKYRTNSQKNRFLIVNYFAFSFINTALLTLLVQGEIGSLSIKNMLSKMFHLQRKLIKVTIYNEFTRRWYVDAGRQILINFLVSLVICPFFTIVVEKFLEEVRKWRAKRAQVQRQMNQLLLDPEMDFNMHYGLALTSIFFTMFYSGGLPILYLFAALSMLAIYVSSKVNFIMFSKRPLLFDHTLNQTISGLLPYALLVHQFAAASFFTVQEIFPKLNDYPGFFQRLLYRLSQGFCFQIVTFLIIIYLVFQKKFDKMFSALFNFQKTSQMLSLLSSSKAFLYSYRFEDNPNYRDIFYTITVLDLLNKKRTEKVSDEGTPVYNKMNKRRISKSETPLEEILETNRMMNDLF